VIFLDDAMRAEPDDRAKMDATTDEDIQRQIVEDPDTAPDMSDEDPAGFVVRRSYPDLNRVRENLGSIGVRSVRPS
jgi:putative transcriptional regulator